MKNKHTPGPWETVAGPTDNDLAVCGPDGGDMIAEIVNGSVADRDLIAAAPDLLAALKMAQYCMDPAHEDILTVQDLARTHKATGAAILKAEGRT